LLFKLTSIDYREFPHSVSDFIQTISPAFDSKYLKSFEAGCNRFDHITGPSSTLPSLPHQTSSLSDIFLRELGFNVWIANICEAIALHCYEAVAPGDKLICPLIPQYDGPVDTPLQAGIISDDGLGPFKQVTLVGPNLYEAWNRDPFTRNLENVCTQSSDWTPSQPGGLYVYHGTAAHLDHPDFILSLAKRPFTGLVGKVNRNQITQGKHSLPIVWTSFSPFRAFLWAAFRADVIRDVPGPLIQSTLTSAWSSENRTYQGVLVLQFSSTQPSPAGLTSYTIPNGQEEQWAAIAAGQGGLESNETTQNLWGRFTNIHKQVKGSEWPNLVHGLELASSRAILHRYTRQFWRTVWFGEGIQSLNSLHRQSLAIQFIIKPDSPPPRYHQTSHQMSPNKRKTFKERFKGIFKKGR
jgi:hypothetical protein